ncbi:LAMP3 protein, partial [Atrichornis clamosus]|nr:LAMP3 protein [Atrichornis clamosus]
TGQAMHTVTAAVKDTSTGHSPTRASTGMTAAATSTSLKDETANTRVSAATASAAATTQRARPSTRAGKQTTATGNPTATAVTSTTSTRPGTQTATTSPATVRPPPAPQPAPIPTGTYTLSDGNRTCIKAVMGLQLMAQNTQKEQMEYVTVNPNATQISGSCGMVQSELNLTFSGGFVNFTFVK